MPAGPFSRVFRRQCGCRRVLERRSSQGGLSRSAAVKPSAWPPYPRGHVGGVFVSRDYGEQQGAVEQRVGTDKARRKRTDGTLPLNPVLDGCDRSEALVGFGLNQKRKCSCEQAVPGGFGQRGLHASTAGSSWGLHSCQWQQPRGGPVVFACSSLPRGRPGRGVVLPWVKEACGLRPSHGRRAQLQRALGCCPLDPSSGRPCSGAAVAAAS